MLVYGKCSVSSCRCCMFVSGRGCKRQSCGKGMLQSRSNDCLVCSQEYLLTCGPPSSFSVHLASSAVTPAGSVHKSRDDNVVLMWVQLK